MKMRESQAEHMPSPWSHQDLVLELGRSNISSVSSSVPMDVSLEITEGGLVSLASMCRRV